MHYWGDDWEHWDDLHEAIDYCCTVWRRYGRIGTVFSKEKYGTFRHNIQFYTAEWPIHQLVKPGYCFYTWPKVFMHIELKLGRVVRFLRLYKPIWFYQRLVYNYAIQKACAKYPAIVDELVSDTSHPEFIKGKVDGQTIHGKYWKVR